MMKLLSLSLWMFFSGCSFVKENVPFMDRTDESALSHVAGYSEPDVASSEDLTLVWRRNLTGSPDAYLYHPLHVALSSDSIVVGTYNGDVIRVRSQDGRLLWKVNLDEPIAGGVAADGKRVFAGTVEGEMVALARDTGDEVWRVKLPTSIMSAPRVAAKKDQLAFLTLNNRTYLLSRENGDRLWSHASLPESLVVMGAAQPTLAGQVWLVGYATGEIFALEQRDGRVLWSNNLMMMNGRSEMDRLQDVDASIVAGAGRLYAVNHRGRLVALKLSSGELLWERSISAIRTPWLERKRLFIVDMNGGLLALSAEDGSTLWRVVLSDGLLTAPVLFGEHVFVADDHGRLFSVDSLSGRVIGLNHLKEPFYAPPRIDPVSASLFLWSNQGTLFRYQVR